MTDVADGLTGVLLVAETKDGAIRSSSQELFGVGATLAGATGGQLVALVIGEQAADAGNDAAELGADRVLIADSPALAEFTVDGYAKAVEAAVDAVQPAAVLLPGTTSGRDIAPFVAARRQAPCLVDCVRVEYTGDGFAGTRPVFQSKLLTNVQATSGALTFVTLRAGAYPVPDRQAGRTAQTETLEVAVSPDDLRVRVVDLVQVEGGSTNLEASDVVVVGGRGLGAADQFSLVEDLAAALDGAVGATRAVTDLGWRPHYEQVGQTGRTISPKLYIGVGVSGAVQHTVGMRGAETIIAFNRDADAPIFKLADFGVVGDLFEIVPALTERLRQVRGK